MKTSRIVLIVAFVLCCISAHADTVSYVNWTSSSISGGTGTVSGTLLGGSVAVTYTGQVSFAQINGIGTNFWSPASTFTSATVSNAPPDADMIAILGSPGVTNTVTFSAPVSGLIMDIMSLGQPGIGTAYTFDTPFTILQIGPSTSFGGGTTTLTASGNTLTGHEGDGIIQFAGPVTSISWTGAATPEFWNGFTFGAPGQPTTVPVAEPSNMALLGTGLVGLGCAMKRKFARS